VRTEGGEAENDADELHGWHRDPFGRFDDRYFIHGEPSQLVRSGGVEASDTVGAHSVQPTIEEPSTAEEPPRTFDVRTMRIIWRVVAVLCGIGALAFLNMHVTASSANGLGPVRLDCGSVMSPRETVTVGRVFTSDGIAMCNTQRRSQETKAIIFGVLAVIGAILAGVTTARDTSSRV